MSDVREGGSPYGRKVGDGRDERIGDVEALNLVAEVPGPVADCGVGGCEVAISPV